MMNLEDVKTRDLTEILETHYGMVFRKSGNQYVGLSPITGEKTPSFFVRCQDDGHWVFKDHSSGTGGTIIDFVMKMEGVVEVKQALSHIGGLFGSGPADGSPAAASQSTDKASYDLAFIHQKIRGNGWGPSGEYLQKRGIEAKLVEELGQSGVLLHNYRKGKSHCCFAVYDRGKNLCCLDNHEIGGSGKFVLGAKGIFTMDWEQLGTAETVFVCESIIDYLSLKTMEGRDQIGLALLGNQVRFPPELLAGAKEVVSALDHDGGGFRGLLDLREVYPDKSIVIKEFEGCKDANELLQARQEKNAATNLSAQDKLQIYEDLMATDNRSEVARTWGINRSYMYEIVQDCRELLLQGMGSRQRGRKPRNGPDSMAEATERLAQLEAEKQQEAKEKERMFARSEFLKLRLKWSEKALAEHEERKESQKRQLKKKKKKKR